MKKRGKKRRERGDWGPREGVLFQQRANAKFAEAVHGDMMGKWRPSVNPVTPSTAIRRRLRIKSASCPIFIRWVMWFRVRHRILRLISTISQPKPSVLWSVPQLMLWATMSQWLHCIGRWFRWTSCCLCFSIQFTHFKIRKPPSVSILSLHPISVGIEYGASHFFLGSPSMWTITFFICLCVEQAKHNGHQQSLSLSQNCFHYFLLHVVFSNACTMYLVYPLHLFMCSWMLFSLPPKKQTDAGACNVP